MAEPVILEDDDLPDDVKVLRRLPKSSNEEWIVGINEFRGNNYVQVRVYYRDEKDDDKLKPGRQGMNVHEELLPEILGGLQDATDLLISMPRGRQSRAKNGNNS
tara:strand:- start:4656 stop:4967 length:312 start_codon:yes stop_codon:yes gene_type:complete